MKQCPTCNRTYADETLTFCLDDGAPLIASYDAEATQRIPAPRTTNPPPTEAAGYSLPRVEPVRPAGNPALMYIIIALLALLVGGGAVALILNTRDKERASTPTPAPTSTQTPQLSRERANTPDNTSENRAGLTMTTDAVNKLLARWEKAQDTQNFAAYESCYDYSFKGVLRTTSGRIKNYTYNEWMQDRRRMISQSGGINVDAKSINIVRLDGDTATVEFDQYYYTPSYSDHGPKVMKIRATPDGEKIVYEELKASYPL